MDRAVAKGSLAVESAGGQGVGGTPGATSSANQHQPPQQQVTQERLPKGGHHHPVQFDQGGG